MVATSEEISRITESIYRNLNEKYYPEIRDLVNYGKIYEKALAGVSQSAKNYAEALIRLGDLAFQSKGSQFLGKVLHQIADTHIRIESEREQNIVIFKKEVLLPLDTKTEQQNKEISIKQKTYLQGNKAKAELHVKAKDKLQKQTTKAQKSKKNYKYDDKLHQSKIEVKEKQEDLHKHRNLGLKEVLLDERIRYCYIIDRECEMLKNYQVYHSKAQHLIESQLSEWQEACRKPGQLPDECVALLIGKENIQSSGGSVHSSNSGRQSRYSGHYDKSLLPSNDRQRSISQPPPAPPIRQQQPHPMPAELVDNSENSSLPPDGSGTIVPAGYHHTHHHVLAHSHSSHSMMLKPPHPHPPPPPPLPGMAQTLPRNYQAHMKTATSDVQFRPMSTVTQTQQRNILHAVYNHTATSPNQMSFNQGDIIAVVGEKRNGWQYGRNTRTEQSGWFPISFTRDSRSIAKLSTPQAISVHTKAKSNSAGNLLADSEIPSTDYTEKPPSFQDSTDSRGLLMFANSPPQPTQYQREREVRVTQYDDNKEFGRQWKQTQPLPSPPPQSSPANGGNNFQNDRYRNNHANQMDSLPPPPPSLIQDNHDESPKSSMFTNVSLRPTMTNDRSAPYIN